MEDLDEWMYVLLVYVQQTKDEACVGMNERLAWAVIIEGEILGAVIGKHDVEELVNHQNR